MRRRSPLYGLASGILLFTYQLRRSPEVLLWYLGFPLILIALVKYVFLTGPSAPTVGLVGPRSLENVLVEAGFKVKIYDDVEEGILDLARGSISALVVVDGGEVKVLYSYPELKGFAWAAGDVIEESLRGGGKNVFTLETIEVEEAPGRTLALYTINIVGIQALYIALYGGMVEIVTMRRDGSLKLVASSPGGALTLSLFLAGYSLTASITSATAVIVFSILLGAEFSGVSLPGALTAALLILSGLLTIFMAALPLSLSIKRHETASAIAGLTGFLAMMGGGLAIPLEELPDTIAAIAQYFPMTVAVRAAGEALLGFKPPLEALASAYPLYTALLIASALGLASYKRIISMAIEE
ncbi:MAG: ABC transporter permease [Desulfurococcales archaeon]|nr:ABC transporter permease [Desulfurococcales archaeon]